MTNNATVTNATFNNSVGVKADKKFS